MSTQATMCVVCEQAVAVLYCQQDEAHLCATCDHQVHSANQLASRHHRVPINQPAPEAAIQPAPDAPKTARVDEPSYSFEDDGLFAVPDVDLPSMAQDEFSPYDPKALLGKDFMSDDFYMNDLDPLWLDRLDVGMDRLPSDILDSLVPEGPPAGSPTAAVVPQATAALRTAEAPAVEPPAAPPAPVHYVPNPHTVAYPPAVPFTAPVPVKPELAVAAIDIDSYTPRTLLPMDPAVRAQLLASRQDKLERFREKKRNRHFKKTIRYASRKAYAEVRPRIKGRFARKDEVAAMRAAGVLPPV